MLKKIYSVYDVKTELFGSPATMLAHGEAIRGFSDACNNPEHEFYKHSSDYSLYYLGEYDETKGHFICGPENLQLTTARECKTNQPSMTMDEYHDSTTKSVVTEL